MYNARLHFTGGRPAMAGLLMLACVLEAGAMLTNVASQKVHYRPGETGVFTGTLKNPGTNAVAVTVCCDLVTDLDRSLGIRTLAMTVPAHGETGIVFHIPLGAAEYGHEVRMWLEGAQDDVQRDFFGVSASVGKIGIYGQNSRYVNYTDTFAWAPDDFGNLSPAQDSWIPGQTASRRFKTELLKQIDGWHARGIKALTYGKGVSGGPDGMQLLVDHPDWAAFNRFGQLGGLDMSFDAWSLKNWYVNDHKTATSNLWYFWNCWTPNFYNPDSARYGAEALVRSARMFGWDGVRFDGQFDIYGGYGIDGAPADRGEDRAAINARNVRLMKDHIRAAFPDFVFGYNYGFPVDNPSVADQAVCAGGGLVMDEGIRNSGDPQHPNNVWTNFAHHILRECAAVRQLGGCPLIFSMAAREADADYALAFCLAGGGQPYGWNYQQVKHPLPAFATRYSSLLWDPAVERDAAAAQHFKVESDRPVWWTDWTRTRRLEGNRTRHILHLFNPPPRDRIGGTPFPEPIRDLRVTILLGAGVSLSKAWLLSPVREVTATPVPLKAGGAGYTAVIPELALWSVLVFDADR